jgi:two-component system nitrate/nitrite response regulator NarL
MKPLRLLVVDDHSLFRRGLVALLAQDERFDVVSQAADSTEAVRCARRDQPDLILLDNHMPGVRGVDAIAGLKEAAPDTHILMLTVSENEADLLAALQAGAEGYLLKTIESDDLSASILRVMAGEPVISPQMMAKLVTAVRQQPGAAPVAAAAAAAEAPAPTDAPPDSLSGREREILLLIARGHSNKLIARELDIAETTVKIHVQHILRKLHLTSRVQAAVYATSRGWA